ncbi:hydrolase [Sulfitobacter sp. SK012]|uniref:alpha/beta fold hydrolase n=1 Tax=Sulfitobacter sp. SK012 TaxID=1389005 RepID=UPI000E0C9562|nr:alpha/beta hydrolase [Sulfitobacter sp. SK012]AXI46507.1 hydrolase [Sulfitobacter sp. SK012]
MSTAGFLPGFAEQRIDCNGVFINCAVAGTGPPVLLLHGHPQTLIVWRKVAPELVAVGYSVVASDLRGYGASDKPASTSDHAPYSKRTMAEDQVTLMGKLGHERFAVIGHDRGGRVAHRMALDAPDAVERVVVIDIAPTATMYAQTDKEFATRYFWWFFLIQPFDLPERLISSDPAYFLRKHIDGQLKTPDAVSDDVFIAYLKAYQQPETIHAICEDYRAAASIDLLHDANDADMRVIAPLLALWGSKGTVGALYDVLETWREKALDVSGCALPCGHSVQEEVPQLFLDHVLPFLAKRQNSR